MTTNDDTSASFSVSSSDQASKPERDEAAAIVLQPLTGQASKSRPTYRDNAIALPARQARADSAPEKGAYGPSPTGRGTRKEASRSKTSGEDRRGRRGPRRVQSDDSDGSREKSWSPMRSNAVAIQKKKKKKKKKKKYVAVGYRIRLWNCRTITSRC